MPQRSNDSGAIAIFVAVTSLVFLMIAALVVDLGMAMDTRREAQKAADLAALAGGQDLPNTVNARATVADYLLANGWGTDADGNAIDRATLISNLTSPSLEDGYVKFNTTTLGATQLTVTTPERNVDFVLAQVGELLGGDGFSGANVDADATVQIRSLKDILPFVLTSDSPYGPTCIKTDNLKADESCPDAETGNYGYAEVGRRDATSKILERNIKFGLDHQPTLYLHNPEYNQGKAGVRIECVSDNNPLTAKLDKSPYPDGFNCLPTNEGMKPPQLHGGLVAYSGPGSCDGRIVEIVGTCKWLPNRLTEYFPAATIADPKSGSDGEVPIDILDDPRFGVLPVVATKTLGPGKKDFIIIDFYGVYLTTAYEKVGKTKTLSALATPPATPSIVAMEGFVFPLRLLDPIASNDSETGDYLGAGPKVPVLVD